MKLQTPATPEPFKPPKSMAVNVAKSTLAAKGETAKESAPLKSEPKPGPVSSGPTADKAFPTGGSSKPANPISKTPAVKSQRKTKPKAFDPVYKINLNCTLAQRDSINATAASLGLTTTAYLLGCENLAAHQLVTYFTGYIDTRDLMAKENSDERLLRIEEFLKSLGLS